VIDAHAGSSGSSEAESDSDMPNVLGIAAYSHNKATPAPAAMAIGAEELHTGKRVSGTAANVATKAVEQVHSNELAEECSERRGESAAPGVVPNVKPLQPHAYQIDINGNVCHTAPRHMRVFVAGTHVARWCCTSRDVYVLPLHVFSSSCDPTSAFSSSSGYASAA
jgi:hypothetical protein